MAGKQLIPEAFIEKSVTPLVHSYGTSYYGYFWWVDTFEHKGKKYVSKEGLGAGGQLIMMFPELDLIAVITAHNKGMGYHGFRLQDAPKNAAVGICRLISPLLAENNGGLALNAAELRV